MLKACLQMSAWAVKIANILHTFKMKRSFYAFSNTGKMRFYNLRSIKGYDVAD